MSGFHDPEITAYTYFLFDKWKKRGETLRAIGQLVNVKHSQVSHVLQLKGGIGAQGQRYLAKLKHPDLPNGGFGGSWDALEKYAKEWFASPASSKVRAAMEAKGLLPPQTDARYPNRARAIALAASLDVDEQVIHSVRASVLKSAKDPSVKWWLLRILIQDHAASEGLLPGDSMPKDRT